MNPTPAALHRYRLHRAGIRNVWQYDEQEFAFGDGRLLLRGKNGAGKSKALEMLLPYLLDGDARALDATGTGRTTLLWLMLDGFEQTNRLGYLWVEFVRTDEEGVDHHLTLGAAVRASQSTKTAKPFFFVTPLRVGEDPHLAPAGQLLSLDQLKSLVGAENVTDRAVEHRARVARELFGLTDPARYRNLLHLLHRLRRPTIGDRIDSGGLVSVLAETLPALDDEVVEKVARNLDDLDAVRADLGRLERTDQALRTFLSGYRGYLQGALRRRAEGASGELDQLAERRKAAGDAARNAETLREREEELAARVEALDDERTAAETDLAALHASTGYRSLKELAEKRATVAALHSAAATAFKSLRQAHSNQEEAGRRLVAEAGRLGVELVELSTAHDELVREAERSGLDPVHLGEPVAPVAAPIAPVVTAELTAPDGDFHLVRHSEVLAVDTDTCATALPAWDAQLDTAQPVIRNRSRTATELAALFERLNQVGHLDAERRDISDTTLLNRHTELRDQLSGGYDATIEEHDGIKLCRLVDDHGPHDIALVGERIAAQAAEARNRLTEREREVFQRFLTGELGDHLSTQVLAAGALVAALNATLSTVRTSHGLGVTLDWKLADGVEADVKAAVDLLRSPSGLRTREQSEQLRDVLQRRIEDARRADSAAGYAAHLRTALDYRDWFTFTPWVVNDAAPAGRRKLSGRTGLSQGEQRVLSYLVLFAAAAAHFTSLAEHAPWAPRLILLDDAFAKVDEPTHARLGRILVDLDLDFVLTSERLIGNWPDVPSLHIYECLRDPHVRGVATLHYTWNGRQRRLVSV